MATSETRHKESPSQTAGPYVHIGCMPHTCGASRGSIADPGATMIAAATPGERIMIEGCVYDGAGDPLKDAMIEIWQADHQGNYPDTPVRPEEHAGEGNGTFTGWGRQASHPDTGRYRFETIKPGPVAFSDGRMQAPHISFWIVARGINIGLATRMYFPGEQANAACPVLSLIEPERRDTMIAARAGDTCTFNIYLQGDKETVFLDI